MKPTSIPLFVVLGLLIGAGTYLGAFHPSILSYGMPVATIAVLISVGFGLGVSLAIRKGVLRYSRERMRPGEKKCPYCGSLQTDRTPDFSNSESKTVEMTCFNCHETWTTDNEEVPPRLPT
jgi:hypothetical protein